jgi:hypothetical protein
MEELNRPNKKLLFGLLIIVNLIASIGDLFITYIGTPDLLREANPLVYTFGLGWNSLIITRAFLVVIMILLYYAFFRFKRVVIQCEGFKQYVSLLFYNRPDKFIWILYKFPKNKVGWSYYAASFGYLLALIIPIGNLFAIILWIGVINDISIIQSYNKFGIMTPIGRSDIIIGGIIILLFMWYYWLSKEYKINKKALENGLIK